MECWESVLSDEDAWVDSPAVRWHDKTGKGWETFKGFVKLHYPESQTLEDWTYYSQLNQRDALRFGIEHFRRSEFCRGTLVWQVNDCWPVQSWAMLDSLGNYKALAYEIRRLYADVLFSITRQDEKVQVWAINDGDDDELVAPILTAHSTLDGSELGSWTTVETLSPGERRVVLEADVAGLNLNETLLVAEDAWQLLGEPKNTRFAAPCPLLVSTAEDGVLRIKTTGPVVDLMLTDEGSPAPFLDNFITEPQAGLFEVRVSRIPDSLEARSLAGVHPIQVTRSPI
jgi:beta-mannosidase